MLKINDLLEGKYEILRQIGKGGMSKVYLAMDTHLNKQWAIKELSKKSNPIAIQSAIAEANLIKKLDHPSLPRIVDIIELTDSICIIMDYIEGKSLDFVLSEYGVPTQEEVIDWAKQLCQVLSYLHSQNPPIIYRDMKPANIMLQPNGRLKIIDFGIAREYKYCNQEDTVALGTIGYAAPEQYQNTSKQTDERTDIYCLGVTLHHLVTGISPTDEFDLAPIRSINPFLSGGLENIIIKCTQKNPMLRYASCQEVLYALEHYEQEDDIYKEKIRKKKILTIFTISLSILFLFSSILSFYFDSKMLHNDYFYLVNQYEKSEDISCLYQAIQSLPYQKEAYLSLINHYKENKFTNKESTQFLSHTLPYLEKYKEKKNEEYSLVAYEIGKLYWYYYTESIDIYRIKERQMAASWFDEVLQYSSNPSLLQTSELYYFLGCFHKEIAKMRNEGTNTIQMYQEYFKKMNELFDLCKKSNQEDIMHLQMNVFVVNSLEGYARDFHKSNIQIEDVLNLYQQVIEDTKQIQSNTEKTDQMKEEILSRETERKIHIENGYTD